MLPPIAPHILTSPILSWHGRCCWCRSHFPCPAWSLSGSQLSKYVCIACLVSMRLSEQYGTVCLCDCVYCYAFFLLLSADISLFECLFSKFCLHLLSACLWTQFSSLRVLKRFTVCSIVLCPFFGMWPGSAMHGRCVGFDMNATCIESPFEKFRAITVLALINKLDSSVCF